MTHISQRKAIRRWGGGDPHQTQQKLMRGKVTAHRNIAPMSTDLCFGNGWWTSVCLLSMSSFPLFSNTISSCFHLFLTRSPRGLGRLILFPTQGGHLIKVWDVIPFHGIASKVARRWTFDAIEPTTENPHRSEGHLGVLSFPWDCWGIERRPGVSGSHIFNQEKNHSKNGQRKAELRSRNGFIAKGFCLTPRTSHAWK